MVCLVCNQFPLTFLIHADGKDLQATTMFVAQFGLAEVTASQTAMLYACIFNFQFYSNYFNAHVNPPGGIQ